MTARAGFAIYSIAVILAARGAMFGHIVNIRRISPVWE
jgi:hypothetical protein